MASKISSAGPRHPHFIKEWRAHRALTQPQLAERLGTSKQSISRIEKGEQPYTQESLEALAQALDCTPADLISRDPRQEPDLPIFDLPMSDKERVRDFIRALRVTRTRDDGTSLPDLPDTAVKSKTDPKRVTPKKA
jgi:transcriptional regulator with XRE-family HTH domain